ncbi:hypothetical protein [Dyella ginsengisoli]|uniref:hypothetical protein n=1 Tax=Dyella ginsengisoli TaxID=363848 RepID=UPI000345D8F6|nr:hypothetical protein [Dyella ginsengisoli]
MISRRLAVHTLLLPWLLAACAGQPHRGPSTRTGPTGDIGRAGGTEPTPGIGIEACDRYLASYRTCHRAAGIFPPGQIEPHYREMRSSLLRDSLDPHIRPQLATRCEVLTRSLREALDGKSCATDSSQVTAPRRNGEDDRS